MRNAVIVGAVRTALGGFNGTLAPVAATQLGGIVITAALERAGVPKEAVDEVIMGQVLPCGSGQNPAKQAAIRAGMPWEVQAFTVNKVCGSGLKAVMLAAQAIQVGDADVVVAGGMENMSAAPYYLEKARFGYRMGPGSIQDHMVHDGLWDIVNDFHMGISNDLCSRKYGVSREDQDRYAAESYRRALRGGPGGPVRAGDRAGAGPAAQGSAAGLRPGRVPARDELRGLGQDGPGLPEGGRRHGRQQLGHQRRGRGGRGHGRGEGAARSAAGCSRPWAAQASAGLDMKYVLVAPILAIPKVLRKEGVDIGTVDLFEINEAFSGSTVAVLRELGLDPAKVNVNGGSVALGHPIGASGCRVLVTLLHEMIRRDRRTGLASLCLGGGEAVAMVVRR